MQGHQHQHYHHPPPPAVVTNTSRRAANKPKNVVAKSTLDIRHNNNISEIQQMLAEKLKIGAEIQEVDARIADIENQLKYTQVSTIESAEDEREHRAKKDALCEQHIRARDERLEHLQKLKRIESKFNEVQYLTQTASILFQYYDLVEKGNNHDPGCINADPKQHEHAVQQQQQSTSILKYFCSEPSPPPPPQTIATTTQSVQTIVAQENVTKAAASEHTTRGSLLDKFMSITDAEYMKSATLVAPLQGAGPEESTCNNCGSHKIITLANDGYSYCAECHAMAYILVDHEKPSYRDPPKEVSFYAYKRSNHLNEWISQIQGKETTEIPEEVYDRILIEIRKQRITNMADITPRKVKEILKTLKINKYYEHTAHIINRLTGVQFPQLSPELEDKLRSMFKQIQTPFLKFAPSKRKNFLSYAYCLHKFIQLLGEDQYLANFPLLKSREKLHQQDQIWKRICADVGWEFYPSL